MAIKQKLQYPVPLYLEAIDVFLQLKKIKRNFLPGM